MLRRTERQGTRVLSWNMMPMSVRGALTAAPSMAIAPSLGAINPATIRSSVDLPQPEGPRKETKSPGLMVRSTGPKA